MSDNIEIKNETKENNLNKNQEQKIENDIDTSSNIQENKTEIKKPENKIDNSVNMNISKVIYRYKIILLGDPFVGKTSIINRYIENKYCKDYSCNVGVEFKIKSIEIDQNTAADLKIWDTCGSEKFRSITRQFYIESNGVILVYDISNMKSFKEIDIWYKDVINNCNDESICFYLVGNKKDLEQNRVIQFEEGEHYANKNGFKFFEVSAKTGENVIDLFFTLAKDITNIMKEKEELFGDEVNDDKKIYLKNNKVKRVKKNCCQN